LLEKPVNESIVFNAAVKLPKDQRPEFLEAACAGNPQLRAEVEGLLEEHDGAGSFLARPAAPQPATEVFRPITEGPGTVIGPYKLLQQVGEGGFGVVYMAEQQRPVRRKVALKIIKPGMDTREVIARFESERQALALMDHPNIARVLDAGATDSGRPYFVMELVKGVPITEYCDKNSLSTEKRLLLFITVCHAVQHAHQKGVIHRDLKPSNVMVTLHDGQPVPKVIDFGVSKATSQQLTEKTLFTAYGQMIGTPAYMSPEQAEMSGLDIDTRSDTYSLGVLLYELLTGTTPFDVGRLRDAGYVEMQRIIREEEPPRPSTRVSTLGEKLTIISGHRSTDPKNLRQTLRGDIDLIVMKAMEKERSRRYDTPNSFADDIQRYLTHEAILARPASTAYKLRKFAQRNQGAVAAVTAIAASLLIGLVVSTAAAIHASRQARLAESGRKEAQGAKEDMERQRDAADRAKVAEVKQREAAQNAIKALRAEEEVATRARKNEQAVIVELNREKETLSRQQEAQRRNLYASDMNLVRLESQRGNLLRMREILMRWMPMADEADLRGFEWTYWYRFLHQAKEVRSFTEPEQVAIAPRGQLAAISRGGQTQIIELSSGRVKYTAQTVLPLGMERKVLSESGVLVEPISRVPGRFELWDAEGKQRTFQLPAGEATNVAYLTISRDGRRIAGYAQYNLARVVVWDIDHSEPIADLKLSGHFNRLRISDDGTRIAAYVCHSQLRQSSTLRPVVEVMELTREGDGIVARSVAVVQHDDDIDSVFFLPDNQRLLLGSLGWSGRYRKELYRWTIGEPKLQQLGTEYMPDYMRGDVSPDGTLFAVSGPSVSTVRLIDTSTGVVVNTLQNEASTIESFSFVNGGKRLVACGTAGAVHEWNLDSGEDLFGLKARPVTGGVSRYAISPDQSMLAFSTYSPNAIQSAGPVSVGLRRLDGTEKVLQTSFGTVSVGNLAFSPDGRLLACETTTSRLLLFDTQTESLKGVAFLPVGIAAASPPAPLRPENLARRPWDFSADGSEVIACGQGQVYRFDTTIAPGGAGGNMRQAYALAEAAYPVEPHLTRRAATGELLLAALEKREESVGVLRLRQARSGEMIGECGIPLAASVRKIVAGPDGRHVGLVHASQSPDEPERTVLWDLQQQELVIEAAGNDLVFSADGAQVAILTTAVHPSPINVAQDIERIQQAALWDITRGQQLSTVSLDGNPADEIRFSPNGRRLLTLHGRAPRVAGDAVPEGRLWDVLSGREVMVVPVADVNHYLWDLSFDPAENRLTCLVLGKPTTVAGGWGATVYDAHPLDAAEEGLLAARLARPIVADLFRQFPLVSQVVATLEEDKEMRPAVREAAIALARQRSDQPPDKILNSCLGLLSSAQRNRNEYIRAFQMAQALQKLLPKDPRAKLALGAAQFRLGQHAEALATLSQEMEGGGRMVKAVRHAWLALSHLRAESLQQAETETNLSLQELVALIASEKIVGLQDVMKSHSEVEVIEEALFALRKAGGNPLGDPAAVQEMAKNWLDLTDANADGKITAEDVPARWESLKRLDRDGNGAVTVEEVEPSLTSATTGLGHADARVRSNSFSILANPSDSRSFHYRGTAWYDLREYDRALADLDEAIRLDPSYMHSFEWRGSTYRNQGNLDRAIADYSEAIRLQPSSVWAIAARGDVRKRKGELDLALADLNEAIRLDPKSTSAYMNRAEVWQKQGEFDKAIADWDEAIRLDPASSARLYSRGIAWQTKGEHAKAIADFTQAIALAPGTGSLLVDRGISQRHLGQLQEALADFSEAIRVNPTYSYAYAHRGQVHFELGNMEQALADYDEVFRLFPSLNWSYSRPFAEKEGEGIIETAAKVCRQAIAAKPESPTNHLNLGQAYARLKKPAEAEAEFRQAIEIQEKLVAKSDSPAEQQLVLGESYNRLGQFLQDSGPSPTAGRRLVQDVGRPDESLKWFGKTIGTLSPLYERDKSPEARMHLWRAYNSRAMAYACLQKHVEAAQDWERMIELIPNLRLRALQATSRIQVEPVADVIADVEKLANSSNEQNGHYNLACVYALASARSKDRQREYADRAMELLGKAFSGDQFGAYDLTRQTYFDPIRDREDFKKLLTRLESNNE